MLPVTGTKSHCDASFGQRFTVTPIQMLNMVCAIVDDGKLKKPYVVKEV